MIDTAMNSTSLRTALQSSKTDAARVARTSNADTAAPAAAPAPAAAAAPLSGPTLNPLGPGEPAQESPEESKEAADALASKIDELNGLMQSIRRELHFSVDSNSGRTVIKVVDAETQEIVRQIPPEEASTIVDSLGSASGGLTRGLKA